MRELRGRLARLIAPLRDRLRDTTVFAFQIGFLAAVILENGLRNVARDIGGIRFLEEGLGEAFANLLGFRKIPKFFGLVDIFEPFSKLDFSGILAPFFPSPTMNVEAPLQQSGQAIGDLISTFVKSLFYQGPREPGFFDVLIRVTIYDVVMLIIPTILIALLLRRPIARFLRSIPRWLGLFLHIAALYAIVMLWGADGGSRELILIYMGINIMLAISLNLVNGYMGEFSVGHAGFMAVGAYVSAILTMWLFTDERVFGPAVLPPEWGMPFGFILALLAGGTAAALAGLLVAFPSFKTRGDYLAIVTLAVNFIVQGVINNMEAIGGARGLNGVPLWTNLTWIFLFALLSVVAIHNLVNSTLGKGIIAIREDEISASLMGVNTRHLKLVAFLVSSFIAGVAGGLFAHYLAYVNPGNFGILKSTEALVMVYLGGMGSISGSIFAAAIFTVLIEALRPLAVLKWVVVPLILISLMLFRPQGLFGFREVRLNLGLRQEVPTPATTVKEVRDATVTD